MNHDPTNPPNPPDARALTARLADWRKFAAAAGATLAAVSNADASIIYVPLNVDVKATGQPRNSRSGGGTTFAAPFSINGQQESAVIHRRFTTNSAASRISNQHAYVASARLRGALNLFNGGQGTSNLVKFRKGSSINGNYQVNAGLLAQQSYRFVGGNTTFRRGNFPTNDVAYAGFQTNGGNFGWLKVEVDAGLGPNGVDQGISGFPDELKIISAAYEDSGGPINAGDGIPAAAPEPSTTALALLAAGSAGVLAWRKRRGEALASAGLAAGAGLS